MSKRFKRQAPPNIYPRDFINIHTCSADRRITVYIMFGPPKMELLPTPMNLYFWSLANVNERNVHGSTITACYRSNVIIKSFSYCCVISLLIMCHEILLTFVTESLCKKGIDISTSDLLPECQVSEHITCMAVNLWTDWLRIQDTLQHSPLQPNPLVTNAKTAHLHHKCHQLSEGTAHTSAISMQL